MFLYIANLKIVLFIQVGRIVKKEKTEFVCGSSLRVDQAKICKKLLLHQGQNRLNLIVQHATGFLYRVHQFCSLHLSMQSAIVKRKGQLVGPSGSRTKWVKPYSGSIVDGSVF